MSATHEIVKQQITNLLELLDKLVKEEPDLVKVRAKIRQAYVELQKEQKDV